jgi:hypothetical protein
MHRGRRERERGDQPSSFKRKEENVVIVRYLELRLEKHDDVRSSQSKNTVSLV